MPPKINELSPSTTVFETTLPVPEQEAGKDEDLFIGLRLKREVAKSIFGKKLDVIVRVIE